MKKRGRPRLNPDKVLTNSEIQRRKYEKKRKLGLCYYCPSKAEIGVLCKPCRDFRNWKRSKKRTLTKEELKRFTT